MIPPDGRPVGGATPYIRHYEPHGSAQPLAWSPEYYLSSPLPRRCPRCCPAGVPPAAVPPAAVPLPPLAAAAAPPLLPLLLPRLEARWSQRWLSPPGTCCDSPSKHRASMRTSCGMKGRAEGERGGTGGCPDPEDAEGRRCVKIKGGIQDGCRVIRAYCTLLK